jgi:RNA polymerase sigma factor (sigma-70 family)
MTATESADLLPTRRSLLSKLKSWDQQDAWREFFNTYWRLLYDVARKAGLDDQHAQDAVQETLVSVASELPGFRYDAKVGTFKSWLRTIARRRIADQLRKRYARKEGEHVDGSLTQIQEEIEGTRPNTPLLDALWDDQWRTHLMSAAMERIKRSVRSSHYQLFELTVLKGCPLGDVAKSFGVSLAMAYVIRHRVGRLVRKEIERLQKNML